MKGFLAFSVIFLLSVASVRADLRQELLSAIRADPKGVSHLLSENSLGRLQADVQSNDPAISSKALLAIWLLGDSQQTVELTWWKSKSPLLRSLAGALLLTGNEENVANAPFLDATRFNETESSHRAFELKMVENESKSIGSALKALIDETYDDNPSEWKSALRLKFSAFP